MPDEPYATRREFDQLVGRLESWFDTHERLHELEDARRTSSRRWAVATVIAAVAAVDGPLVTILLARR